MIIILWMWHPKATETNNYLHSHINFCFGVSSSPSMDVSGQSEEVQAPEHFFAVSRHSSVLYLA